MSVGIWPEFDNLPKTRGMKQILDEIGGELAEKTGGILRFRVRAATRGTDQLQYSCLLQIASLGLSFPLLHVNTGLEPFPAEVVWEDSVISNIADETELKNTLSTIFHDEKTKALIANLIAVGQ